MQKHDWKQSTTVFPHSSRVSEFTKRHSEHNLGVSLQIAGSRTKWYQLSIWGNSQENSVKCEKQFAPFPGLQSVRLLLSASPLTGAVCWAWASTFFFTIYLNYALLHDAFTHCNDKAMFRSVSNYILDTNTMIGNYHPPVRRQQRNLSTAGIFSI